MCELHAHTTWSDGVLRTRDVVDLYGGLGFDVLCITDHVVRQPDPWGSPACVTAENHGEYLAELFNRRELFPWVAERGLPAIATGEFHRP